MGIVVIAVFVAAGLGARAGAQEAQPAPPGTGESTTSTSTSSSTSTTVKSSSTTTTSTASSTTVTATESDQPAEPTTTSVVPETRPAIPAAVGETDIPVGSVLIAAGVLAVMGVLVGLALRRRPDRSAPTGSDGAVLLDPVEPDDNATSAMAGPISSPLEEDEVSSGPERIGHAPVPADGRDKRTTLQFLLAAGGALIDAGDPVDDVDRRVSRIARRNGVADVGVVVLPTALMVSVPGDHTVQTEVRSAGRVRLRLGQIDEVFRIVEEAERGLISPAAGLTALAEARRTSPLFSPVVRLMGALLMAAGLVPVLGGNWRDLIVASALGLGMGAFQMAVERRSDLVREVQAFVPLVGSFAVATVVFALGRVVPDLSAFVPLAAPLATLLPGALLTTAVLELSTGQLISGAGRFASGGLQLALLAIGIVAGAQLVGVPSSSITESVSDPVGVAMAWLGVAVFGTGVFYFHGSRRSSLLWISVVLYAAYAGQVLGGVFFGGVLSSFFGALAMTPVAMLASRRLSGPPMLVSFLPGFWLLVPGALGLIGVTRFLGGEQLAGLDVLVTTLATMIAIALGVLLGIAIGNRIPTRETSASSAEV